MGILDKFILLINELITIRTQQMLIYKTLSNTKESNSLPFKIKNYKKWIETINQHILNNSNSNNSSINIKNKSDIVNLKLTDKLELYLIELFETDNIKEINNAKIDLIKLKESTQSKEIIESVQTEQLPIAQLDTSKIESQPKILNGEVRPSDARGGAIFDLRYVHGIGPKNAIKLVDNGVTLEGLLSEWKEWISKDDTNSIITLYKMQKPKQYTKTQWDSLDKYKKYSILETNLKQKLTYETKMLHKIHKSSLVGVKHFHDMSEKIPRDEIKTAETILKKIALHMNKDLLVMICGSYRRGRDKSGDVDCLIAHPLIKTKDDLENNPTNLLESFVELLMNYNFIIDQLDMGNKKFMGFCNIMQFIKQKQTPNTHNTPNTPNKHNIARRIDIRIVPFESYGSAILYFTGSKTFNTNMRAHALKKGYSLSEFGLTKVSDGKLIPCSTEEEIFKIINYPYKTPVERDI
jgi:DNA polymerase/3'-5' exonuclease PolX